MDDQTDLSQFRERAKASRKKAKEIVAAEELRIQALNRHTDLCNAAQAFRSVWSETFLKSLPADRLTTSDFDLPATFWTEIRPEFDDWRTAETIRVCADPRMQAWKEEILALEENDVPERNSAVLMLKAAVMGQADIVRELWTSMLPEAMDDRHRFPDVDRALLPAYLLLWLAMKLPEELRSGTQPTTREPVAPQTDLDVSGRNDASDTVEDGPAKDSISFHFAGNTYTEELEPIAWRFMKATFWRRGEFVNARDLVKEVWERDVNQDVWKKNPDSVLSEPAAKDVVFKVNSFFRRHSLPFHAEQNARTGPRVLALLDGHPRAASKGQ